MQQTIDINLIKENPKLFFSQFNEDAENEFIHLLQYFVFKYNIDFNIKKETHIKSKDSFIDFIENNKIKLPKDFKFNREEAHER